MATQKIYDAALSFSGSERPYIEKVARHLRNMGLSIFYDGYEDISLWGKNLHEHLQDVFCNRSRYVVIFISKNYRKRAWARHERRSALERAISLRTEYVLPARFDDTTIPGISSTTGFVDLRKYSPKRFSILVREKIGHIPRRNFIPEHPDRFYNGLRLRTEYKKIAYKQALIDFVERLSHVSRKARLVLYSILHNACACGFPENAHVRMDVICGILKTSRPNIIKLLAEMDWCGIRTRCYYDKDKCKDSNIVRRREIIEVKYWSGDSLLPDNTTPLLFSILYCLHEVLCPDCARNAFLAMDFSALGMATSQPHEIIVKN
ncbi:MAG: TIR domain-containing protein [Candidatus Aminicenantes bacterium]|nr:TIR domain-containing protein [Candidatus Aminicenantes bacterium]